MPGTPLEATQLLEWSLAVEKGSGALGRRILGSVVIVGMLAATGLAIFVIPSLFVMVEKFATRRRRQGSAEGGQESLTPTPGSPEA